MNAATDKERAEPPPPDPPTAGSMWNALSGNCRPSPSRPPTSGVRRAKKATAAAPAMASPNWIRSVVTTPRRPDSDT